MRWLAIALVLGIPLATRAGVAPSDGVVVARADEKEESVAQQPVEGPKEEQGGAAEPAQEPATTVEPPTGVETLHVLGKGAGAIETEVPSSITQFDASTIEALGAQDISDLSRVTPNVNIVQPGSTQAIFFVRGIGLSDFSSNAAGAVTIFQDDVSINAPAIQTGQLFDVEGVEIVRGPQGTGPFRNASAGAIRVRSRRPTGNYEASLRGSFGRYDTQGNKGARHANIQDYEGALGLPIVEDWLSTRFAFRLRDAQPYKRNGCGNAVPIAQRGQVPFRLTDRSRLIQDPTVQMCGERDEFNWPRLQQSRIPEGLPRWVNDEHNWAARGMLRLKPPDSDFEFFLNAHGSRLDQDSTLGQAIGTAGCLQGAGECFHFAGQAIGGGYVDPDVVKEFEELCVRPFPGSPACLNPYAGTTLAKRLASKRPLDGKPYRGDYNRVGETTRDAYGGFVSGEATLPGELKLFGLTSYDTYDRFSETDTDFTSDAAFEIVQGDEAWQTYDELRLEGELESEPVEWELGAYYLREKLDTTSTVFLFPDTGAIEIFRPFTQDLDSYAAWGKFSWDFADDFTLEGGVRYNYERKQFDFRRRQTTGGQLQSPDDDRTVNQDETWQAPTGQIILTYHIDENASAYAKYARGFKAGHFNSLATRNLNEPPADAEYNDSWEAGVRGMWLDRRVSLSTAFFYYRYEGYQVFLFTDSPQPNEPPVLAILNAQRAENYGVEVEGAFTPLRGLVPRLLEGLRITGNFSWLHGEYLDFSTTRNFAFAGRVFPVQVDYSGKQLQNAPEYKVSSTVEWTFDLGRWGYLIPRYDMSWSDDVFFDPNEGRGSVDPTGGPNLTKYAIGQKQYFLHNVRLGYRVPSGNIEVAVWVRNVEDQVYKNFAFDASRFSGLVINFAGEPRSMGFDVNFQF